MRNLVSIVIPVYNMSASIERTVQSLLVQDYREIEILLVDDGSVDDSYAICKKIATQDERIKVYHIENSGSGPARNVGIERANGAWIYFPDADDYIYPNAISTMVKGTENGTYDLVVFGFEWIKKNHVILTHSYKEDRISAAELRKDYSQCVMMTCPRGIQGAPWNKLFKLETIKKHHIEYPPLRRHQDEAFIADYMCHAQQVHFIPDVLYSYYLNDLQKEWEKYPVDYYKAVIGLYKTRKETILSWSKEDHLTHEYIDSEYICKAIKSIELLYSPKARMTPAERKTEIKHIISCTRLKHFDAPPMLGIYQRTILSLIKKDAINSLYFIFSLKVSLERFK